MARESHFNEQRVLVLPSAVLPPYFGVEEFHEESSTLRDIRALIARSGYFLERLAAEHDSSVVQVIAYGILRHHDTILCIKRSRKSSSPSLRLKYTVLFGGHVDDIGSSTPLEACIGREFEEELGITHPTSSPQLLGIAIDPTNDVGRRHIGMIFDIPHSDGAVQITPVQDTAEFVYAGRSSYHEFMGWQELRGHIDNLDPWSRLFLSSNCAARLLDAPELIVSEKPLGLIWLT
jgi:predicted NUDIX family phosphoesterase